MSDFFLNEVYGKIVMAISAASETAKRVSGRLNKLRDEPSATELYLTLSDIGRMRRDCLAVRDSVGMLKISKTFTFHINYSYSAIISGSKELGATDGTQKSPFGEVVFSTHCHIVQAFGHYELAMAELERFAAEQQAEADARNAAYQKEKENQQQ